MPFRAYLVHRYFYKWCITIYKICCIRKRVHIFTVVLLFSSFIFLGQDANRLGYNPAQNEFNEPYIDINLEEDHDKIWLNLHNDLGAFSQILVGFIPGATNQEDRNYDGTRFIGTNPVAFYSLIEDSRFTIQGRELRTGLDIIPLGVFTSIVEDVTLNISIDELQGTLNNENIEILLEDKILNLTHNLKTSSYTFDLNSPGYYDDRFNLIIKESGILHTGSSEFDANLIVERKGSKITFKTKNNAMIVRFKASDFLGRSLMDINPKKNHYTLKSHNFQVGSVLLINIELDNNESFSKKIMLLK